MFAREKFIFSSIRFSSVPLNSCAASHHDLPLCLSLLWDRSSSIVHAVPSLCAINNSRGGNHSPNSAPLDFNQFFEFTAKPSWAGNQACLHPHPLSAGLPPLGQRHATSQHRDIYILFQPPFLDGRWGSPGAAPVTYGPGDTTERDLFDPRSVPGLVCMIHYLSR